MDRGHADGQRPEVPGFAHKETEGGHYRVRDQTYVDGALSAHTISKFAERKRERDAEELDEDQGTDHVSLPDADLHAIDGRHADDRVHPVVIDEKGQQEKEQIPMPANLSQGRRDARESRRHRVEARSLSRSELRVGLPDRPK